MNQVTSHIAKAIDLYSASAVDLDIVCYFLDFQEIKESQRKTQNLVISLLEFVHAAQSALAKAFICNGEFDGKSKPWPRVPLMY